MDFPNGTLIGMFIEEARRADLQPSEMLPLFRCHLEEIEEAREQAKKKKGE